MPDDLTNALDQIRERARYAVTYDDWHQVGRDARLLIAAVEAVRHLADEWDAVDPDRPWAAMVREAITRKLTGTPGNGEDGDG